MWSAVIELPLRHTGSLILDIVVELLHENGFIPEDFVIGETKSFYNSLGIDGTQRGIDKSLLSFSTNVFIDMYFRSESVVSYDLTF